jgi:cardiolipin synthase
VETPEGTLLTNGPGRGPYLMTGALLRDIHSAETIDIISAYFLPPRQLRRAMMRASRQGRRVRLILAGKSDVKLSQLASRHLYKGLLRAGIQIYEYQPQILHTKLYLFDDTFYVGSANMDKRSLMVNYELLVRVKHRNLSGYGRVFFEGTLKNCKLIDPVEWRRSRTFWNRLREQWAYFLLSKVDPYLTQLQLDVMRKELVEQTQQAAAARQPS